MASAYYQLERGSYQRQPGWLVTTENAVDGTEMANRLFAAHLDYLGVTHRFGFAPVRPRALGGDTAPRQNRQSAVRSTREPTNCVPSTLVCSMATRV
jgi:hypothetical protein